MAKRVRTVVDIYDDLTGELLPENQGQTITFAWRGRSYEIDLSDTNAAQLDDFMSKITGASRRLDTKRASHHKPKVNGAQRPAEGQQELPPAAHKALSAAQTAAEARASGEALTPYQLQMEKRNFLREVRLWAQQNGFPHQGMTGRIRPEVREAFNAAHPDRPMPPEEEADGTKRRREQLAQAG